LSWLRTRRSGAPAPAPETPAAPPEPEVHRSLALGELFAGLDPGRRLHVLDLGPAVGANVAFLTAGFPCRLHVADLYGTLAAEGTRATDPEADLGGLFRRALPAPERGFDLVLGWDLVDYLTRPQIRALAGALAPLCRPGGEVFLMVSTGREIPQNPGTYQFRDAGTLVYRGRTERTRAGPRYRPADIDELMRGFTVDRSYLLRHGVQEYLLARTAG
jgi:hypothetical protein